jgi:hypothetical protein
MTEFSPYAMVLALSSAVGIRPFLTLAICAWMMYAGYLHPSAQFHWLGASGTAIVLSVLAFLEFAGDKIPFVDHALQALHFAVKPATAALIADSAIPSGDPQAATYAIMLAAALNALGVHGATTTVRAASTATSLGVANPLISVAEDVLAVIGIVIALTLPFLGVVLCVVLLWLSVIVLKSGFAFVRKRRMTR